MTSSEAVLSPETTEDALYIEDGCDGAEKIPNLKSKKRAEKAEKMFQYGIIQLGLRNRKMVKSLTFG